jgi:hypothetical protein
MAVILIEGFDHYDEGAGTRTVSEYERKYRHVDSQSLDGHSSDTPNSKGSALTLDGNQKRFWPYFGYYYRNENVGWSVPEGVIGFHFKTTSVSTDTGVAIVELGYGRTSASPQMSIRIDGTTGKLKLYRGLNTQELGVSSSNLTNNTWYYIELKYQISNSIDSNSTILRVDAQDWITLPATTDTQAGGTNEVHAMKWQSANGASRYIDNLYVCDTSGTYNNGDFLNQGAGCFVETLRPSSNGTYAQFTPQASTNTSQVDDVAPDEDTTYNESSTINHKDTFNFPNMPDNVGTIHGVNTVCFARRNSMKMSRIRQLCRVSSTNYTKQYKFSSLDQNFDYFMYLWEENPNAGGLWTEAGLNGAQFGYTFDTTIDASTVAY